jgi:peroxiredoxin
MFLRKILFVFCCLAILFCKAQQVTLINTSGEKIVDAQLIKGKATVFYFLSPECPLCQSYSLTINNLAKEFAAKGITMVGIIPGADYSNLEISTFKNKYKLTIAIWKDEKFELVKKYKATITPEAVVVNGKNQVLYQGRIDNWAYELGKKRKIITEHNLQDALMSVVNNKPVKVTRTKAVGCFIE